MKPKYVVCKHCGHRVSKLLLHEAESFDMLVGKEFEPLVNNQYYSLDKEENIFICIKDKINLKYHKDKSRFIGCCGSSNFGLPNLMCWNCLAELGREVTDCCTAHYVRFSKEMVEFKDELSDYIQCFEAKKLFATQQNELELLLKYGQKDDVEAFLKEV